MNNYNLTQKQIEEYYFSFINTEQGKKLNDDLNYAFNEYLKTIFEPVSSTNEEIEELKKQNREILKLIKNLDKQKKN